MGQALNPFGHVLSGESIRKIIQHTLDYIA